MPRMPVLGWDGYPVTIDRFRRASDGKVIVESWLLHGMSHDYPGGDPRGTFVDEHAQDIDSPMYEFFLANARS